MPTLTFTTRLCGILLFLFLGSRQSYAQINGEVMTDSMAIQCYMDAFGLFGTDPSLAIAHFEELIPFFKHYGLWNGYTGSFNALSSIHHYLGNYEQAETYAREGMGESKKYLTIDNLQYHNAFHNLAYFYREKGKWEQAVEIQEEILRDNEALKNKNYAVISRAYFNIGITYDRAGDIPKALQYYEQSLKIQREHSSLKYNFTANLFLAIGWAHTRNKLWIKAKEAYELATKFSDPLTQTTAYYSLAEVHLGLKRTDSARFFLEKGRAVDRGNNKAKYQIGEELLAEIYLFEGNEAKALTHFISSQKLRLKQANVKSISLDIARGYKKIGELLQARRDFTGSLEQFHLGIITLSTGITDSSDWKILPQVDAIKIPRDAMDLLEAKASSLFSLYQDSQDIEDLQLAHEHIKLAVELISTINQIQKSEESKLRLSQEARSLVELGIKISTHLYESSQNTAYLWDALDFAEEIKSRLLKEEILASEALSQTQLPDSLRLRLDGIKSDINFYKKFISKSDPSLQDSSQLEKWKSLIFDLETRQADLLKSIEKKYPAYKEKRWNTPTMPSQTLSNRLQRGEVLMEYFWGKTHLYIFTVNKSSISFRAAKLEDSLLNLIDQVGTFVRKPDLSIHAYQRFIQDAYKLYHTLGLASLESDEHTALYLIPDGPLSYIPFEVLLTDETALSLGTQSDLNPAQAYRKLPYLFQSYKVHYLYAASLMQLKSVSNAHYQHALAAFAPNYLGSLQLKHNKASAEEIGKIIGGELFLDQDASEKSFKTHAVKYRAVHLAVHANSDVQTAINAYLEFGKQDNSQDDGRLFVHELYTLTLNTEIVSLIACEAGYGKLETGEGVMSLSRAFRMAGAKNVLTSLWKADGRAASPISNEFYRQLKAGQKPSEALQLSKKQFLAQASPDMTHPYFWATYVLTGNNEVVWNGYLTQYGLYMALLALLLFLGWMYTKNNRKIKLS